MSGPHLDSAIRDEAAGPVGGVGSDSTEDADEPGATEPGAIEPGAIEYETDVLVVGTGPAGATAALALATYGIRVHALTRYRWLSNTPRAHITNQRAMEVFRDLGVQAEVERHGSAWELMGDTLITTSLAGPEIARIRTWGTSDAQQGAYRAASPCPMLDIPQPYLESVLVRNAGQRGAEFSFSTEYLGLDQDPDGVTVRLRDRRSGRLYRVRARYLVGADGANSAVARDIGLPIAGEMGRASTAYVQFTADLTGYVAHRPSILNWIAAQGGAYGEIGLGLLRAVRPWTEWIAGWGFDPAAGAPDLSPAAVRARISEYIGDPTVAVELGPGSTWLVNQAYATEYARGRVFCAGDAVHRHPPSGGLGSNTSVQDAYNLAWKLAYVMRGWAGPELLDSYSAERAPVGRQVVERANASRRDFAALNAVLRDPDRANSLDGVVDRLRDPGPGGAATRDALGRALARKDYEFNAHGVELNQRYASAAVVPDPQSEVWTADPELVAQPSSRPGAKLPHAWLVDAGGRRVSTLDLVGRGRTVLVTGLSGTAWVRAAGRLAGPGFDVVVIGAAGQADLYRDWQRVGQVHDAGALLVRPDGVVAWRHAGELWDADSAWAELTQAMGALGLDRAMVGSTP